VRPTISSKVALATLAVATFAACGGDSDSGGSATGEAQTIVIKDFKFEPANLKVAPGAKVTVKNEDGAAHTVTAGDGSFDTGNLEAKAQKEITVSKAGQISYRCDIHQYMTGVIQVNGS
jgi:plastocyanin